ncbi:MAG: MTH1187 family thiamine-binding protein, partial [Candidatus Korarchaeota archaeon]|nr:MTH1187 family thiamine-binding protein [Candidatus Korarchaeota archaeon]NIU85583.1 MTH1187 family thiamine-binding protein [Candidatus Thorarchaeota archaeon]NIW15127.1 MTH1187 family thiamine-binding protein [Candidatus Thorarchaeota archaeon]NIW53132.1 MTH1187 family thiamine-binding protein [Candidatus Korarchaeota archaeon]
MARIIASFSCVPVGTKDTSLSSYVAAGLRALQQRKDVTYELGPMSTILEGERLREIFAAIEAVEQAMVDA